MRASRLARALALVLGAAMALAAHAATVTQATTLGRTDLQTPNRTVTLTAPATAPGTVQELALALRYVETPLAAEGGNAWTCTVRYKVTLGAGTPSPRSLTLFRGTDRDAFEAVDRIAAGSATTARLEIEGFDTPDALAVPASVRLEARWTSTTFAGFVRTASPVLAYSAAPEPRVTWPPVPGAEEYELETVFVDDTTPAPADPFRAALPVRVQTRSPSLPVDLQRPSGKLFLRARAVGRHAAEPRARRPGAWSAALMVPVGPASFEASRNWTFRGIYDAGGPTVRKVAYLDGALRLRQVQDTAPGQTVLSTGLGGTAAPQPARRVAETRYDLEGRAAVNFLAVPEPGNGLAFLPGFNRAADGTPFGPEHFDLDGVTAASTASGAARYFSPQATVGGPASAYVPDAGGYPFTVAQHTRDGSARLRAMSGYGPAQRLGKHHDRYVYGDANEAQLQPLFGSNAGDASRYERTVTGDANDAFEVLYRDGADRVVAQALVGDPPANLADLPGAPAPALRTVSMDASNRVDALAGRSTLSYRIANAVNTAYHFTYSPTGVDYAANPGDPRFPPLCESCRYRLRIRIVGPDGAPVPLAVGSTPQNDAGCSGLAGTIPAPLIDQLIANPNPPACTAPADRTSGYTVPPVRFCATFAQPGEYEVQKTLELVDGDIDHRIEVLERTPGFFDVSTAATPRPDPASCGETCTAHCAQATGADPGAVPRPAALTQCIERCEHPDGWAMDHVERDKCDSLEDQLRADMAPGGRHHQAGGNNDVSRHPEYCHVGVCRALSTSDRYDLLLGDARTQADALCQGGLNPTGLAVDPVLGPPARPATCTGAPALDPFFAAGGPGASLRATIDGQLRNFTSTVSGWSGPALSIWQFAADPRINGATGSGPDEQWRLWRSLYLGLKQRLVIQATESAGIFNCPYLPDPTARVPKPNIPTTVTAVNAAIQGATVTQCQQLCTVRVAQWVERLKQACPSRFDEVAVRQGLATYCASRCGSTNPLALLTDEEVQAGAPGLAAVQAALGPCSLDAIAVPDPYVRITTCRERCCSGSGATACASALVKVLGERLPATSQPPPVAATPDGDTLRKKCLDWVELVEFRRDVSVLRNQGGQQRCAVVLFGPDGKPLPPAQTRVLGPPRTPATPPPTAGGGAAPAYTGLVVDAEANGQRVVAAIHSDCPIRWIETYPEPVCQETVSVEGPPGTCGGDGKKPGRAAAALPPSIHCAETAASPAPEGRPGGEVPRDREPAPGGPCPGCLDELVRLLENHKAAEYARLVKVDGSCILTAILEGDALLVTQPGPQGPTRCEIRFVDGNGRVIPAGRMIAFGRVERDASLPPGVPATLGNARFAGLAVELATTTGREKAYVFTDCDLVSPEHCDGGCTPIGRPSPCWERLFTAVRTGAPVRRSPCFADLGRDTQGILVHLAGGARCRVVALGSAGRPVPWDELRRGTPRTVATDPGRAPPGLTFTGYVIDTRRGPAAVYSDCPFPPTPDCDTFVIGIDSPPPPPVGDPGKVCEQAVKDATDQLARVAVEVARGDFERTFKSVHYDRCFGGALRESFLYQARDREYHFTLRYYDQAGNLVQTVPPEGVDPVPGATATTAVRHRMASRFRYDSLERITSRTTPDAGEQRFLYDRADRARFSQSAQQRVDGKWAYVKYDGRGRAIETGLLSGVGEAVIRARLDDPAFPAAADGTHEDVIQTVHDTATSVPACAPLSPRNLRSRVAAVVALTTLGAATLCYSYDELGRPEAVLRDLPGLGTKRVAYQYDPVTGSVAAVHYQAGQADALHQRYRYTRAGQLESAESSRDGVIWEHDARFGHYAHGPLARMELGEDRVQGVDYTYTVDGRPKGLNTGTLTPERDPGHDGLAGSANAAVAPDVAGLSLDYFLGDYAPVGLARGALTAATDPHPAALSPGAGGPVASAFALASCTQVSVADGCGLYEGNVVRGVLGLDGLGAAARVTGFAYRYDRLYRLTRATSHAGLDPATNRWPATAPGPSLWRTELGYDGNGNITALSRDAPAPGAPGAPAPMDRLAYRYPLDAQQRLTANRLLHVGDAVAAAAFPEDLDDQGPFTAGTPGTHNYAYDAAGRLTQDRAAGLTAIRWNADNQVSAVEKAGETLAFAYDGRGQRFAKVRQPGPDPATWEIEYFVRDERSNLLATYRRAPAQPPAAAAPPALEELYLRAGVPLGVIRADRPVPAAVAPGTLALIRGDKQYQVANYRGNVLATVSDRRAAVLGPGGAIDHYAALAITSTDYDPFGAVQPGRFLESDPYRFGFAGFERDDELKGRGASYYAEERLYDPRLGRWLSPDPVEPAQRSPYAAFANDPLRFSDPRGTWDKDAILDTLENVAITARDMGRDTARILSGQAAGEAIAENLIKAKASLDKGQYSEALGHAIGVQDAVDSLMEKELAWQEAGATTEDMIRMGIGEVSGMNDVIRGVTGETEFAEEIPPLEAAQLVIQGGVKVVTIAATGAQIGSAALGPKAVTPKGAPKASVKPIEGPPCPVSFDPDTPVWTAAGPIAIGEIESGAGVLTLHPESGRVGVFAVVTPLVTRHEVATRLVLVAPDGRSEAILTTPEHHFWQEGAGWVAARDLAPGLRVAGAAGWLTVASAQSFAHRFDAINLTVDDAQTYLVGDLGAWVHNCKKFSSGKPPHKMEATVKRGGKVVEKRQFTSGNMTPAEKKLGFPKGPLSSHTENRATRRLALKPGDKATFKGTYEPCPSCKGAMNRKAAKSGAGIEYRWGDEVWKAKGKK